MSKALQGAALIGAAVGFIAVAALVPGAAVLVANVAIDNIVAGIGLAGVGMEAGAIANALTSNRGENITIRQPAAPRQIVYGVQRVGGVLTFGSTTGSHKDQLNRLFVLSTHELYAIQNLYLDGRQVYFAGGGQGWTVRNGYGFGGGGDGNSHVGPDGSSYTFNNATSGHSGVYVEARYGDQVSGDYMTSLQANDGRWSPDANGNNPYGGGCAYIYLKCEADANLFPQEPEIKATVLGKPVYDPRTGETTYSDNWALVLADYITDPDYGLGDVVNQEQLIAAANICDELVACAAGEEKRYTCHYHFDTSTAAGDIISAMLLAAGGRLSYIGGEWYLWPATWIAPTLSFIEDDLIDKPTWKPYRNYRSLFNRVQGTWTAANYPYSAASGTGLLSDEYDSNGWYNGTIENTFPFAFQPQSYPTYAMDTLHGYASDQWLTADGGVELFQTLDLPAVLSVSQAQRLAKIELLRCRQQGIGTFVFGVKGYQLQPGDTFYMSFAQRGWVDKVLEVTDVQFIVDKDENGTPLIKVVVQAQECASTVYEWNSTDELTPYDVPANTFNPNGYVTAAPTNMELVSSAATALLQPDGTVIPRIQITWDTPADVRVTSIAVQWQLVGASAWTDGGTVSAASNIAYIPAVAGQQYNVQIRSVSSSGATSNWVTINAFTAGLVLSVSTQNGVGIGSMVGEAYADGTAAIVCDPFSTMYGSNTVSIFPSGAVTISGLTQQTLYYVYYIDSTFTGGDVVPIATTNQSDYLGKIGYFLIDSIVTPYCATTGTSGTRYSPSTYQDLGTRTTSNPVAAYDGDVTSAAVVSAQAISTTAISNGQCTFQGFPNIALTSASTLTVVSSVSLTGVGSASIDVLVNGADTNLLSTSATTAQTSYTFSVPASTNLSTITVSVSATADYVSTDGGGTLLTADVAAPVGVTTRGGTSSVSRVNVYEIYITS